MDTGDEGRGGKNERKKERRERTPQSLKLIPHPLQSQSMTRQILTDRKFERGRIVRELQLSGFAEGMDEGGVEEEGLDGEAGEIECPDEREKTE